MSLWYLAKVPAFVLMSVAENYAFHPPTNPPPKEVADREKFGSADMITKLTGWFPAVGALVSYSFHFAECAAVIAHEFPSETSSKVLSFLFKDPSAADRLVIGRTFIAGFLLLTVGGALRKVCYDTLGKFFTYQLAIFKDHKLITSGPYGVVRHPAYIAFLMANTGFLTILYAPGSYLWESGLLETRWIAAFLGTFGLMAASLLVVTVRRVPREDAVMRKEFGKEWEQWAKRTPYRLIPYLY
ncbi:hypothetical protein L226DRAFT_460934 [Lentinus tigrinus ALCF2SS1-7]|uniref:Protein-S-isoprenylcysteine O-methyltransferase n=1 Tax=Lentinus tigrinus ALCF2SS1-6 TaxID=1328759 RepID=A0A5C2SA88_9APHY|nr:hypothetical protein L227DRAFT_91832 [Lentinus tigrinus ALCF2SS1-6]RPD75843.1 hypothetical protein L226DRAFT_460934 [Lentinus tigrinus ALCF2SS1-7]